MIDWFRNYLDKNIDNEGEKLKRLIDLEIPLIRISTIREKKPKWLIDLEINLDEVGKSRWLINLEIFLDTNIDKEGEKFKWLIDLEISLDKNINNEGGGEPTWLIDLEIP